MTEALPRHVEGWAFFLDFDGTLVDIAAMPNEVIVPHDLPTVLTRIADKAGGALAVVSGRTIASLDQMLAPARFPTAGIHGFELRFPNGEYMASGASSGVTEARRAFQEFASRHRGLLVEDKGAAVALHYRAVPHLGAAAVAAAEAAAARTSGAMSVLNGKMVVELRPAGVDKGRALAALMERAPFRGRTPIAVGDDLTDQDMLAAARNRGGLAVAVGPQIPTSAANIHISDAASVRRWLASLE